MPAAKVVRHRASLPGTAVELIASRRQAAVRGRASCGNGPRARANSLAGSHSRRRRIDRVPSIHSDTVRVQIDDRRRQVPDTGQGRILRPLGRSLTTDPWMAETASLRTAKRPWAAPRPSRQGQASSTSFCVLSPLEVNAPVRATVRSFESHGLRGASRQNRGGVASQMADRGPDDGFQTANLHFMASRLLYCVTRYYHA